MVAKKAALRRAFAKLAANSDLRANGSTLRQIRQRANSPSNSERIPVVREVRGASIDPHGLVALTGTVVGHAGGARRRSRDLAALVLELLRQNLVLVSSRLCHGRRGD